MLSKKIFFTLHFSEERNEAGKNQGGFGAKWDGGGASQGGDGGGGGGDGVGHLLQAPVTDMKAPPLR